MLRPSALLVIVTLLAGCASSGHHNPAKAGAIPASSTAVAASYIHCRAEIASPKKPYAISGIKLKTYLSAYDTSPYPYDLATTWNSDGLRVGPAGHVRYLSHGRWYVHPVASAQYGLAAYREWRHTGQRVWLDRALASARDLADQQTTAGLLPYRFPMQLANGHYAPGPTYSAMAQGQAISLYVRAFRATKNNLWKQRSRDAFDAMATPGSRSRSVTFVDKAGFLWFEEYPMACPGRVFNGHMFATFGVLDYYRMTHDQLAGKLFDAAVTTIEHYLPVMRVKGSISAYAVTENRAHYENYHRVHIWQLRFLARVTGHQALARWAAKLQADHAPPT